jgi:hypothetical protein
MRARERLLGRRQQPLLLRQYAQQHALRVHRGRTDVPIWHPRPQNRCSTSPRDTGVRTISHSSQVTKWPRMVTRAVLIDRFTYC